MNRSGRALICTRAICLALISFAAVPIAAEVHRLDVRGATLHVEADGPLGAPAVLLWNGAACTTRMWDNVVPRLSDRFRVIRFDVRGTGQSTPSASDAGYTFEIYSGDAVAILDHFGYDTSIVWSMAWGSRAAIAYAALHPERVALLALYDASVDPANRQAQIDGRERALKVQEAAGIPVISRPDGWNRNLDEAEIEKALGAAEAFGDLRPLLSKIPAPTFVCTGNFDPNLASSRVIAQEIPNARLEVMPNVGHGSVLQRPDLTTELFLGFVGEHSDILPVGWARTSTRTVDGEYISWRERIIDDSESSRAEISGSDGLVMGDLDGDGHEDIVSVHESDTTYDGQPEGQIRIAFGSADPNAWINVALADGPEAAAAEDAAIGDLNGDGHPDVVAACELAHLIYFENPGGEARSKPWRRVIPGVTENRGSYIRVFVADFNGDGKLEVVAPNKGAQNPALDTKEKHPISIFEIVGDALEGNWREHELGRYIIPQNAHPVDLDSDGDMDIVGGSRGERRVMWFENLGGEGFNFAERRIDIDGGEAGGFNMDFADLNHDGRLDIVLAFGLTDLGWIEQPAATTDRWTAHSIGTFAPDSMISVTVADINGDGALDVMAGGYSRGPRDRDGDLTPNDSLGRIGWFEQPADPAGQWIRHDVSRRKRGMFDKFVARDLDRDGDMDFVGTRGNSEPYDGVFWLEQVRSDAPGIAFQRERADDSREMRLPVTRK